MPNPKLPPLELSDIERQGLENLVSRHKVGQQVALRGRIVLAAATGKNNSQIAWELNISLATVRTWRQRWLDLQAVALDDLSIAERLADLARPGAPARITADQICKLMEMACTEPGESERPISQWTGRELADEAIKRGIVDQISPRHAARLLKRRRSQTTPDPLLVDARS
jgi:putative transposase